jgi:uncharacterized protein YndB with AHSA1/START domain/uncharacterized protein (DUF1330 family)
MPPVYALNLFDLAPNDDYRAYSRRSVDAVARHGGRVVSLGRLAGCAEGDVEPRQVMVVVEWPSREAFDAFVADPSLEDLHPLRERGTERYLWWLYERLDDLRPLFALRREDGLVRCSAERTVNVDPAAVWDVAADPASLARWFAGVEEASVSGRPGQGQRHVARGPGAGGRRYELERVTEDWEPQGYVRWRTLSERLDGVLCEDPGTGDTWLELHVEPSASGTRVRLEGRRAPTGDACSQRPQGAPATTEEQLRASLDRLAELLHG